MKQTSLTKDEEALYQLWAKGFNVPTGGSYDMLLRKTNFPARFTIILEEDKKDYKL